MFIRVLMVTVVFALCTWAYNHSSYDFDFYFKYTGIYDDALYSESDNSILVPAYVVSMNNVDEHTYGIRIPRVRWGCTGDYGLEKTGFALKGKNIYYYLNKFSGRYVEFKTLEKFKDYLRDLDIVALGDLNHAKIDRLKERYKSHPNITMFIEFVQCNGVISEIE